MGSFNRAVWKQRKLFLFLCGEGVSAQWTMLSPFPLENPFAAKLFTP